MPAKEKSLRHQPVTRDHHSAAAILFVHGIQGSPDQFKWFIELLPPTVDVYNVLLPGHGKGILNFAKTAMRDWQGCIDRVSAELCEKYEKVIYVGHSMGCLLGMDAEIRGAGRYGHMVLLACPLRLRPTYRYMRNNLLSLISKKADDPYVAAAREANSINEKCPILYILGIRQYLALLAKIGRVRRQVHLLQASADAIYSGKDEIVSIRSADCFSKKPNVNTLMLPESGHYRYSDMDKRTIYTIIANLI